MTIRRQSGVVFISQRSKSPTDDCARKFFTKITSDQVKYDVVDSYGKLMELVK